ncbi:hypothetical protein C8Q70DRAFT_252573 [Cubamyces menziesii]|nr:hypothetical protein C8Q70DRAFT_252573 [Cubamyces menziesii]
MLIITHGCSSFLLHHSLAIRLEFGCATSGYLVRLISVSKPRNDCVKLLACRLIIAQMQSQTPYVLAEHAHCGHLLAIYWTIRTRSSKGCFLQLRACS